jgi:hypothetical protein
MERIWFWLRKREGLPRKIAAGAAFYASIMDNAGKMVIFNVWKQQEENAF